MLDKTGPCTEDPAAGKEERRTINSISQRKTRGAAKIPDLSHLITEPSSTQPNELLLCLVKLHDVVLKKPILSLYIFFVQQQAEALVIAYFKSQAVKAERYVPHH